MASFFLTGSGIGACQDARVANKVLELLAAKNSPPKSGEPVRLLYIGTCTYDDPECETKQTERLVERGCELTALRVTHNETTPPINVIENLINNAHIILISGGNTQFAMDRWENLGGSRGGAAGPHVDHYKGRKGGIMGYF